MIAIPPVRAWFRLSETGLEHIPPSGPAIVACNHLSYLDPLTNASAVMRAGRRPRFLAKDELFRIPVVGLAFKGAKQIPVVRGTGDATSALRAAEAALAAGEVVVVYPEGTVTSRPDHLPMRGKTGVVRLSLSTGVPITPLASWGSQAVWQKSGRGSLRFGRPVWTRVGPAIYPTPRDGAGDQPAALQPAALQPTADVIQSMTAKVMSVLTAMVQELRDAYPRRWADAD